MISPTWHRFGIVLATAGGGHPVEGWRLHVGALLVVTPQLSSELIVLRDEPRRFVITHTPTGVRLWPNDFELARAMQLCEQLLLLDGWANYQENPRLIAAAEAIVRRHLGGAVVGGVVG
jgi:hypothetical protein